MDMLVNMLVNMVVVEIIVSQTITTTPVGNVLDPISITVRSSVNVRVDMFVPVAVTSDHTVTAIRSVDNLHYVPVVVRVSSTERKVGFGFVKGALEYQ